MTMLAAHLTVFDALIPGFAPKRVPLRQRIRAALAAAEARHEAREAYERLLAMGPDTLADVGVSRGEVEAALRAL